MCKVGYIRKIPMIALHCTDSDSDQLRFGILPATKLSNNTTGTNH